MITAEQQVLRAIEAHHGSREHYMQCHPECAWPRVSDMQKVIAVVDAAREHPEFETMPRYDKLRLALFGLVCAEER